MLSGWLLSALAVAYLGLLFAVAFYGDRYSIYPAHQRLRPYIYGLALGVYCTSWTFYGAVGTAARENRRDGGDSLPGIAVQGSRRQHRRTDRRRRVDATEHHEGLMLAIAFESLLKVMAFMAMGLYAWLQLKGARFELPARLQSAAPLSAARNSGWSSTMRSW